MKHIKEMEEGTGLDNFTKETFDVGHKEWRLIQTHYDDSVSARDLFIIKIIAPTEADALAIWVFYTIGSMADLKSYTEEALGYDITNPQSFNELYDIAAVSEDFNGIKSAEDTCFFIKIDPFTQEVKVTEKIDDLQKLLDHVLNATEEDEEED